MLSSLFLVSPPKQQRFASTLTPRSSNGSSEPRVKKAPVDVLSATPLMRRCSSLDEVTLAFAIEASSVKEVTLEAFLNQSFLDSNIGEKGRFTLTLSSPESLNSIASGGKEFFKKHSAFLHSITLLVTLDNFDKFETELEAFLHNCSDSKSFPFEISVSLRCDSMADLISFSFLGSTGQPRPIIQYIKSIGGEMKKPRVIDRSVFQCKLDELTALESINFPEFEITEKTTFESPKSVRAIKVLNPNDSICRRLFPETSEDSLSPLKPLIY